MNILFFVVTMILLLTTMTYTKLTLFFNHQLLSNHFESSFQQKEDILFEEEAKDRYANTHIPKKNTSSPNPQPQPKGLSKLSWSIFLNAQEREQDPSKEKEIMNVSKKLILSLFENQQTVKKKLEKDPHILDRFFSALKESSEKLPHKMKIKDARHLVTLHLNDKELNFLSYELFKDNPQYEEQVDSKKEFKKVNVKKSFSLLSELTVEKGKTRLYLASKNLLKATFGDDENLINQIFEKRKELHLAAKKLNPYDPAPLTKEFEDFFDQMAPHVNKNIFDFRVTKTNPKAYE